MLQQTENLIVTLTTWSKRIHNIPVVLDTIFCQTKKVDLIVLNLAGDDFIPNDINEYLTSHNVEVNRVPYKKVYKKLIPTLKKYPNDCIISIDDDWLYPPTMVEDFWNTHIKYPNNPISGNREFINGYTCHCGCASLSKASFFVDLELIDRDVMENCISDDAVYTFFSVRSGHPYLWTNNLYFTNMQAFNPTDSYSILDPINDSVRDTWTYLISRFGGLPSLNELLLKDTMIEKIIQKKELLEFSKAFTDGKDDVYSSFSYKIGYLLLKPLNWIRERTLELFSSYVTQKNIIISRIKVFIIYTKHDKNRN